MSDGFLLREHEVCLKPSAVIGVIGGYLGLLMSIFQVLYIFLSRSLESDILKRYMGDYHIIDPFADFHKTKSKRMTINVPTADNHHPPSDNIQTGVVVVDHHITHVNHEA